MPSSSGDTRPRIAVFAGPTATVLNSYPLRTGSEPLYPQRLARPVTVYVEQFSAHPLERDAAHLYAPPDGYVAADGAFSSSRQSNDDVPVYAVELRPEDGLYPLPFAGRRRDGRPWDDTEGPGDAEYRQTFYPDAARVFEEIDRFELGPDGRNRQLSSQADFDHYRLAPSGGYTRGVEADRRTDVGEGPIAPESLGVDFFPYSPPDKRREPLARTLARLTNKAHAVLRGERYDGAIWLEGSPFVEETAYWLNLLLDVSVPVVACAGSIGSAGRTNIVDALTYLLSRIWADGDGRDKVGVVAVQDEQVITAREVQKIDDRPGGYVATGGHGGVVGTIGKPGDPVLTFLPTRRHTWNSSVRLTRLPARVRGLCRRDNRIEGCEVPVLDGEGRLRDDCVPDVRIVKHARYTQRTASTDDTAEVELRERLLRSTQRPALVGFVLEAGTPYGDVSAPMERAVETVIHQGVPVVRVGRGNVGGFVPQSRVPTGIAGGNLTATKARLLLMACLLRFGALPPARDPERPTPEESAAVRSTLAAYRDVFESH